MRGALIIVALLEIVVGVAVFAGAPTSVQEIGGVLLFGFGVLTMAVMYIAVTFEGLWKKYQEEQVPATHAS